MNHCSKQPDRPDQSFRVRCAATDEPLRCHRCSRTHSLASRWTSSHWTPACRDRPSSEWSWCPTSHRVSSSLGSGGRCRNSRRWRRSNLKAAPRRRATESTDCNAANQRRHADIGQTAAGTGRHRRARCRACTSCAGADRTDAHTAALSSHTGCDCCRISSTRLRKGAGRRATPDRHGSDADAAHLDGHGDVDQAACARTGEDAGSGCPGCRWIRCTIGRAGIREQEYRYQPGGLTMRSSASSRLGNEQSRYTGDGADHCEGGRLNVA